MAKAAELDTDLVNGFKLAKTKRVYFAFVLKGGNDGALILSKAKVAPAAIAEAKKQSGGSAVLKGFCSYEEGTYIFETAKQAPATAAQAVKIIAKRDAGLAVKAEFRISTDPELLADEPEGAVATPTAPPRPTAPPPQAAPTSPVDGSHLVKRLNAMTPDIKAALAGPKKAQVQALYVSVSGQIKSKAFPEAAKGLDELEKLIKPVDSQTPPKTAQPDGAELMKRLNALTPEIKVALAGPNKAGIQVLFAAVTGQIKSKDLPQASKGLDELEQLVKPGKDGATRQPNSKLEAALADWTKARQAAVDQLEKLADAFKTSTHPKAQQGIEILKRAITMNLTKRPDTAQQVAELLRYVDTDNLFTDAETPNPYGFTVKIRAPLLNALGELKKHVA